MTDKVKAKPNTKCAKCGHARKRHSPNYDSGMCDVGYATWNARCPCPGFVRKQAQERAEEGRI